MFTLFTPEDLTRWGFDLRSVWAGREKGITLLPNRSGYGPYDLLAQYYADRVTAEDFQQLAADIHSSCSSNKHADLSSRAVGVKQKSKGQFYFLLHVEKSEILFPT